VARWWEDVIQADATLGDCGDPKSSARSLSSDAPPLRMQVLTQRLGSINSGKARPQFVRSFGDFVKDDWMPVICQHSSTQHRSTIGHARRASHSGHSAKAARELTREELQSFLSESQQGFHGRRSTTSMWSEQNSQRSRRVGCDQRERSSEDETPRDDSMSGANCTDSGQVRNSLRL